MTHPSTRRSRALDASSTTHRSGRCDPDAPSDAYLRFWGTRGSIPSPGPGTVRYGGNTSCVEICSGETRLIFDAGSGIRALGASMFEEGPNSIHIFLTHFHWDHIQGFPFFRPLYDPEDVIRVVAPKQKEIGVKNLFAGQMGPIYFPVPFRFVAAKTEFEHLNQGSYEIDGIELDVMRVRHPSFVLAYRIRIGDAVVCFVPDNELEGDMYDELEPGFDSRIVDFVGDADVLIHDSMYTEEEYPGRRGWGHSTFEQSLRLAREGGVRELLFFHHDPMRTDDELDAIVRRLQDEVAGDTSPISISAAAEGEYHTLDT
jgi:phosphoribosyl 1,2-cyclic phosphodiesterase